MPNSAERVTAKTQAIFAELVQDRAFSLQGFPQGIYSVVASALQKRYGEERARQLAFHMIDWNEDAAFIVALLLYPERFSKDEVCAGIEGFLIHAPNHITAASTIAAERDGEE
ncbi:MAG: hypothetical protein JWN40_1982 [Phycisphaerales bacterium]|nr:hypothetical protein [Phycisphaerales bacterium]